MTTITFRNIHKAEAEHHAQLACKNRNLKPNTKEYEDCYNSAYIEYLGQIMESLTVENKKDFEKYITDRADFVENPSSPKIADYLWKEFKTFQNDGFFDILSDKLSKKEIEARKSQFKGAILSLSNILLEVSAGIKSKSKKDGDLAKRDEISDYQFKKWPENYSPASDILDDMIQVEINRYTRIYVVAYIMFLIDNMFEQNKNLDINKELKENEFLFNKDKETQKVTYSSINSKESRLKFLKNVNKMIREDYLNALKKYQEE